VAGGGGGIRTHETLSGLTVFKTAGVNRFPTPPGLIVAYLLDSDRVRSCPIVAQFPFQTLHCSNSFRSRSLDVEGEGGANVRVPENRLNRPGTRSSKSDLIRAPAAFPRLLSPLQSHTRDVACRWERWFSRAAFAIQRWVRLEHVSATVTTGRGYMTA
jgi:hypothetical protein